MFRIAYLAAMAATVLLLILPPSASLHAQAALAGPCAYWPAYGTVIELATGERARITEATAGAIVQNALDCVKDSLPDKGKGLETQGTPGDRRRQLERQAALLEQAASGNDLVDAQRQVVRHVMSALGAGDKSAAAAGDSRHLVETYQKNCIAAGVPIPPPLGSAEWQAGPPLGGEVRRYFILRDMSDVRMWTYGRKGEGFCVALLRRDPAITTQMPMIGTICSNAGQTAACFFDNLTYEKGGRLSEEETMKTDYSKLVHPNDVDEQCSFCHLGQNPFIVHPGTALGQTIMKLYKDGYGGAAQPSFKFVDFGDSRTWRNPAPVSAGETGACTRCHNLAKVTPDDKRHCMIIEEAANWTMPPVLPGKGIGWPDGNGCFRDDVQHLKAYFASVRALKRMCSEAPVGNCP